MYSEKTFTKGYIYTVFIHVVYQYIPLYTIYMYIFTNKPVTLISMLWKKNCMHGFEL